VVRHLLPVILFCLPRERLPSAAVSPIILFSTQGQGSSPITPYFLCPFPSRVFLVPFFFDPSWSILDWFSDKSPLPPFFCTFPLPNTSSSAPSTSMPVPVVRTGMFAQLGYKDSLISLLFKRYILPACPASLNAPISSTPGFSPTLKARM